MGTILKNHPPFHPATGLVNRHVQTLTPVFLGKFKKIFYKRQELILPDGDFVDLDWLSMPDSDTEKPILIVFHGLEGSSQSHYVKSLMHAVENKNWHAVVMNFRSCSGRQNRQARMYHSGETEDAGFLVDWIKKQFPSAPLFAVGYSLGGNMLLKLAGEQGEVLALKAMVAVSAPVKLNESTQYMVQGLSRFYQSHLLKSLKHKMLEKYSQHDYKSMIDLNRSDIANCKDIRQFDDMFTSRMHGFDGAEDYYARCSAYQFIERITKPCLIIHADDDPIAPSSILPTESSLPESVLLEVYPKGGHVGFLGGSIFSPNYWLAERMITYLEHFQ